MNKFSLLQVWVEQLQELVEELDNSDDDGEFEDIVEHLTSARDKLQELGTEEG